MAKKEKAAPVAEVSVEQAPAAATAPRVRGPQGVPESARITLLSAVNPKRAGSKAAEAFAHYRDGMSVAEYCDAAGKEATPNLVYDAAHGYIAIEGYSPANPFVPKERAPKAAKEPKAPRAKKEKAPKAEKAPNPELELEVQTETVD